MDTIHRLLAYAAAAVTVVGIAWSLLLVLRSRQAAPGFERFQAAVVSLIIVGAASGVLLLLSGARPGEGLHLLYAVIALTIIPLARSFLGRTSERRTAVLLLVAFVALGAVIYRLFTTA